MDEILTTHRLLFFFGLFMQRWWLTNYTLQICTIPASYAPLARVICTWAKQNAKLSSLIVSDGMFIIFTPPSLLVASSCPSALVFLGPRGILVLLYQPLSSSGQTHSSAVVYLWWPTAHIRSSLVTFTLAADAQFLL